MSIRTAAITLATCAATLAHAQPQSSSASGPQLPPAAQESLRGAANGADSCFDAPNITGTGVFSFDNTDATTDGLGHALCLLDGQNQVANDLWWRWTSQCTGEVTVQTCGLTTVDTRIAVYAPAAFCPPTDNFLLDCGDVECGLQTRVTFSAIAGQTYLIRLGNFPPGSPGTGSFEIRCAGEFDLCTDTVACQEGDLFNSHWSDNNTFRAADDIVIPATGEITGLCFLGGYGFSVDPQGSVDSFVVTYYRDQAGFPGTPIARFRQGSDLALEARRSTGQLISNNTLEWEYVVCHAPVPVQRNERIWVEVVNENDPLGGANWYWEISNEGNLRALVDSSVGTPYNDAFALGTDFAFCLRFRTCPTDINKNGTTDFSDLNAILVNFGFDCD